MPLERLKHARKLLTMHPIETAAVSGLGTLAIMGLLAGGAAYAARWPTSQIFGSTLIDAPEPPGPAHTIALTYDDGPSERNTPGLLDLLAAADIRATFFLIGNHVRRHPELARRIAEAGHTIGNHTDMHPDLARKKAERIHEELTRCQQTIFDITGVKPAFFRPPYGSRRPAVLSIARELGLTPVLWNITAQDWKPLGAPGILRNIDRGLSRNRRSSRSSNLLLHDASHLDGTAPQSRADTLAVTTDLLRRPNLRFVTVADIAAPHEPHGGR